MSKMIKSLMGYLTKPRVLYKNKGGHVVSNERKLNRYWHYDVYKQNKLGIWHSPSYLLLDEKLERENNNDTA